MIEVKTPKNILVYKTRILGPLTLRQSICIFIVIVLDFIFYQAVIKNVSLTPEIIFYLYMLIDVPLLAIGYIEIAGMPLEKYLKYYLNSVFLAPSVRKNKKILYKKETVEQKKKTRSSKTHKAYK